MEKQGQCLTSFQRKLLLKNLKSDLRPEYLRRIKIMLMADAGKSQAQICAELRCSHETARYWIFIAQMGEAHKWSDRSIGRPKVVDTRYLERLRELVHHSPRQYGYSFQRWTAGWLSKQLEKELGIKVGDRHINRLLKNMGLSTRGISAKSAKEESLTGTNSIAIHDMDRDIQALPADLLWSLDLIQSRG